jgi:large subunit ribosomal protein L10
MAQTRNQKQELIDRYQGGLAGARHAFLVNFEGLTVAQATDLRSRIREQGGSYEVVKNRLALRAIEGRQIGELKEHFQGPTAVAYVDDDPVILAKTLTDFKKDVPAIQFKGALVDGQTVGADEVEAISKMPGREELLAKLLFLLQSPITRLARGLAAIPRQLVVVLDQVAKQKA